ncbi:PP2C family protein-serine/threonine phosphatase [Spiribacter halobius]|uniref:Serine/threonine-protein phosphatase n=1 Tax=Sediminicurvatus halobius TaxID=2182432 RepID=A0A2U2MX56_9GAMM|nr:protein phosphatase 2C domain-containing protein [Spiribacter halobius]PWG61440.1 serine/threonine-protein phosphatase [Spiribacter halobius]UEX76936.1 protein phosphatase 2C domain-containing protein [Spiribacter halobius]
MPVAIAGYSHVGRVRARNEDAIDWDDALGVAVVADGLGGHPAGDVASRLAVEAVLHMARNESGGGNWLEAGGDPVSATQLAHQTLLAHGRRHRSTAGMGTTLVVAVRAPGRVVLAHVGDSRAYRFHAGALERLTRDHNAAQEAVSEGRMTAAQARMSPERHHLTRAVGVDPDVRPERTESVLEADDWLLLASDGLTGEVDDAEIESILAEAADPADAARRLVTAAIGHGGRDNVSVVVMPGVG